MHIHIYATRFPNVDLSGPASHRGHPDFMLSPVQPAVLRDWLVRPAEVIAATVESPEAAAVWHARWIEDNPRPAWFWDLDGAEVFVERVRVMLSERGDRVDGFHVDGVNVMATFIPCPTVCGRYACPVGRTDGDGEWGGG